MTQDVPGRLHEASRTCAFGSVQENNPRVQTFTGGMLTPLCMSEAIGIYCSDHVKMARFLY